MRQELKKSKFLSERQVIKIHHWVSQMKKFRSLTVRQKKRKAKHALHFHYKSLGSGKHRIVYDIRNGYVLKIPLTTRGLISNKTEFKLYHRCPSNLHKYLCPVIEYGHGWVVMKKMEPLNKMNEEYEKQLSKTKRKFRHKGIHPHDLKCENITYSRRIKRIVVIDYGSFR